MLRPHHRRAGASRRRLRGRGRHVSGLCLPGGTSHDSLRVHAAAYGSPDAAPRNDRAWPGIRPLPSSFFTMSNSLLRGLRRAASPVPAAHVLRPGCHVRFVSTASPLTSPTAARACAPKLGRHQLRPRTEGPAERREAHYLRLCRAGKYATPRLRGVAVPRNRDAASRRSTVAFARSPLRLRHCRSRGKAGSPAIVHGGAARRIPSAVTSRAGRHIPAPPAGSSPEDAPHERGWEFPRL